LAAATGVACVAALAVAPASAATDDRPSALPRIKGHVGPGFEISINKASVPAGRYKLIVKDEGTIHNFHILGTGVDKATGIPETGTFKFRIRLSPGTYQIQCDQHSASMNTTLTVT
jgi:plastocyanin